jgi:hypothetical protein
MTFNQKVLIFFEFTGLEKENPCITLGPWEKSIFIHFWPNSLKQSLRTSDPFSKGLFFFFLWY